MAENQDFTYTEEQTDTSPNESSTQTSDLPDNFEIPFIYNPDACSTDEESEVEEKKKKRKSARQIRHEENLKMQGKWKEPSRPYKAEERFIQLPNSKTMIQTSYQRGEKPLGGVRQVTVTHVESTNEIYLRMERDYQNFDEINKKLVELYEGKDVPVLPSMLFALDNACVVKHDGQWHRGRIFHVHHRAGVVVQLADIGVQLQRIPPNEYHRIKVLLAEPPLDSGEQTYRSKISRLCEFNASTGENNLLKELLPVGTKLMADYDRKTRQKCYRVRLWLNEGDPTFADIFETEILERRIYSTLVARRPRIVRWSNAAPPGNGASARPYETKLQRVSSVASVRSTANTFEGYFGLGHCSDSDRDSTESITELTEDRKETVKTWVESKEHKYPKYEAKKGLTLEDLKELEKYSTLWDNQEDAKEYEKEFLGNTGSISAKYPFLARGTTVSSDIIVYKDQ